MISPAVLIYHKQSEHLALRPRAEPGTTALLASVFGNLMLMSQCQAVGSLASCRSDVPLAHVSAGRGTQISLALWWSSSNPSYLSLQLFQHFLPLGSESPLVQGNQTSSVCDLNISKESPSTSLDAWETFREGLQY